MLVLAGEVKFSGINPQIRDPSLPVHAGLYLFSADGKERPAVVSMFTGTVGAASVAMEYHSRVQCRSTVSQCTIVARCRSVVSQHRVAV